MSDFLLGMAVPVGLGLLCFLAYHRKAVLSAPRRFADDIADVIAIAVIMAFFTRRKP